MILYKKRYRAWREVPNKSQCKMVESDSFLVLSRFFAKTERVDATYYVMEYIGKHDCNEVEMCEDDFVLCHDGAIRVIEYCQEEACYKARHIVGEKYQEPMYINEDNFKIIGNKYVGKKN